MKWLAIIVALALSQGLGPARAEEAKGSRVADPADPGAPMVRQAYVSPFATYRPFSAGEVGAWRTVNDEVGRIGGWRVYAQEAYEAAEAEKAAKAAAPGGPPPRPPEAAPGK